MRRTCSSSEEAVAAAADTAGASSNVESCSYSSSKVVVVVIDNALSVVQRVSATRWGVVGSSKGMVTCVRTNLYDAGKTFNACGTFQREENGADEEGGGSTTEDETPDPQVETEAAEDNETASLLVPRTRRCCGCGCIAAKDFGGGGKGLVVEAGRRLPFSAVPVDDVDESVSPCCPVLEGPTITERYTGASSSILLVVAVTVPTAAAGFFAS